MLSSTRLHQVSEYLGDEVVVVGVQQPDSSITPGFAIVADLQKSGLGDVLKSPFGVQPLRCSTKLHSRLLQLRTQDRPGQFALIRQHEVVFSSSIAMLKQMNAQLNGSASGFATRRFRSADRRGVQPWRRRHPCGRPASDAAHRLRERPRQSTQSKRICRAAASMEFAI